MKEGLAFVYAGISSEDMGLLNVQVDSPGLFEEQFLGDRTITEISIRGREKPYFQHVTRLPLVLTLTFAFKDTYDEAKIREVARWLDQEYYQPFYTDDNPTRIFYCMLQSSSALLHNGLKHGYVKVEMRCDSPYTYSPVYVTEEYTITDSGTIVFENEGDTSCYPEIWITKSGAGDFSIVNQTNGGIDFKFVGLADGEAVYVDCENQYIETTLSNTYRYDSFNDNYLEMVRGINTLNVTGSAIVQFRYKFKTLQG